MAVRIRLARRGRKKRPFYHIIVADSRSPRDGRFIQKIGSYNPMTKPATIELDVDLAYDWLMKGAQPSDTARAILRYKGVLYKKHLLRGVTKGVMTEEEALAKWEAWIQNKEAQIAKQRANTKAEKEALLQKVSGELPVDIPKLDQDEEVVEAKPEVKKEAPKETKKDAPSKAEPSDEVAIKEEPVAEVTTEPTQEESAPAEEPEAKTIEETQVKEEDAKPDSKPEAKQIKEVEVEEVKEEEKPKGTSEESKSEAEKVSETKEEVEAEEPEQSKEQAGEKE